MYDPVTPPVLKPIRKAVLPVAGFGTRVLPSAKATPKELLNVVDRPVLSYVVQEAREAGIEQIVFVTGRQKGAIEDYFDHHFELEARLSAGSRNDALQALLMELPAPGSMSFTRQMQPLGLGHAVWCARHIVGDEPFAVLLPDVITHGERGALSQLLNVYEQIGGNVVSVQTVSDDETHRCGIIDPLERSGTRITVKAMVEKPAPGTAPSNLSIAGRYILQPEIFGLLETQGPGAGGEIQLTDAMIRLLTSQAFTAVECEGLTFDCGDRIGLLRANLALALARPDLAEAARAAVIDLVPKI